MRFLTFCMLFLLTFSVVTLPPHARPLRAEGLSVAIINTDIRPVVTYDQPMRILKNLGWKVSYHSLQDVLDDGIDSVFEKKPNFSIFLLGFEFLRAPEDSFVKKNVLSALSRSAQVEGGATIVMLPGCMSDEKQYNRTMAPTFNALGLGEFCGLSSWMEPGKSIARSLMQFLITPLTRRGLSYHTTLRNPAEKSTLVKMPKFFLKDASGDIALSLPYQFSGRFDDNGPLRSLFPLGMLFFSPAMQHSFVFAPDTLMTTFGCYESFQIFPLLKDLQEDFATLSACFWADIDAWVRLSGDLSRRNIETAFQTGRTNKLIQSGAAFPEEPRVAVKHKKKKKTAWMELLAFEETGSESFGELKKKREQQRKLIDATLQADLDCLWISLSPQMYYGVHAKNPEKKDIFERSVVRFCHELQKEAHLRGQGFPKILVGFEIVNNLYNEHLPENPAVDVYGSVNADVPSPCSKQFWIQEVIDPFKKFMNFVRSKRLDHLFDGILLDLELYGRRSASEFTPLMLCDKSIAKEFCAARHVDCEFSTQQEFIDWVSKERLWKELVVFVGKKIHECALMVQKAVVAPGVFPGASIGVYSQTISVDLFCKNFLPGLVSRGKPLNWFTFHTAFDRVRSVVEKELGGLNVLHSSVVMLSKMTDNQVASLVLLKALISKNDGVWFNRWSRIAEPHDLLAWHRVEQPAVFLPQSRVEFYRNIAALGRV